MTSNRAFYIVLKTAKVRQFRNLWSHNSNYKPLLYIAEHPLSHHQPKMLACDASQLASTYLQFPRFFNASKCSLASVLALFAPPPTTSSPVHTRKYVHGAIASHWGGKRVSLAAAIAVYLFSFDATQTPVVVHSVEKTRNRIHARMISQSRHRIK